MLWCAHLMLCYLCYVLWIRCGVQIWCTRRYILEGGYTYEQVIDIVALD